jgi:ATP-binding cassette subfamily B protein
MKDLLRVTKFAFKYWPSMLLSFMMNLIQVASGFVVPYLMMIIIDDAIVNNDRGLLYQTALLMLLVVVIGLIAGLVNNYSSQRVAIFTGADLRNKIFAKIQKLSFSSLDKFKTSRLITTASNDVMRIQTFYQMLLRIVVRAPLMVIYGLIFAISTSKELSQLYFVSIPLLVIAIVIVMILATPKFTKVQKTIDGINKVTLETANAPRVIKSFVTIEHENKKFEEANELYRKTNSSANKIMAIAEPSVMFIMNATLGALIALGAYYVDQGVLLTNTGEPALGVLMAFSNYSMQTLFGVLMFAMMMIFLARASVSAKRINEVLVEEITLENSANPITDFSLTGDIEFKDVTFSYGTDHPVIQNISFKVNRGETIGIIGSTGSGKSSLIQLIPRLYDVTKGSVLVDGVDVKDIDLETLRSQISLVTQTATIFSGSVGTNILQGNNKASIEELNEASKYAVADEFITEYDDFYNHKIEQNGTNLSGGQKQRISLARAFVRNPRILILDDSTSAVDAKSEAVILEAIARLTKNMTAIVISQKISTIKDMDKILVLNNKGELDGFDSHENLLNTSNVYKEIAMSQLGNGGGLDA